MANIVVLGTNIFAKERESVYSATLTKTSYRWTKKLCTLLDLCVSSLRRGHANLLCIVPILTDDPRRESENTEHTSRWTTETQLRKTPSQPKLRGFPRARGGPGRANGRANDRANDRANGRANGRANATRCLTND